MRLRNHIEDVTMEEPYMGEEIPIRWLLFEQSVLDAVKSGTKYLDLDEVWHKAPVSFHCPIVSFVIIFSFTFLRFENEYFISFLRCYNVPYLLRVTSLKVFDLSIQSER